MAQGWGEEMVYMQHDSRFVICKLSCKCAPCEYAAGDHLLPKLSVMKNEESFLRIFLSKPLHGIPREERLRKRVDSGCQPGFCVGAGGGGRAGGGRAAAPPPPPGVGVHSKEGSILFLRSYI